MFAVGDWIMYGISGVCRVAKIGKPQFASGDHKKLYSPWFPNMGLKRSMRQWILPYLCGLS